MTPSTAARAGAAIRRALPCLRSCRMCSRAISTFLRAAAPIIRRAAALLPAEETRKKSSHRRREPIAAHRNGGRFVQALFLLTRGRNEHLGSRRELAPLTAHIGDDHCFRRDDDLLFSLLVGDGDLLAFNALYDLRDGRIGHGAVGQTIPRPEAFGRAAAVFGKNVKGYFLLAPVRL